MSGMKRKRCFPMVFLFCLFCFLDCFGTENINFPDAVILYTGDIRGNINPTGCCTLIGGTAKRISTIHELRAKYKNNILVDTGDCIKNETEAWLNQLKIIHMARAFKATHYDALNLSDGEILAGDAFFDSFFPGADFPLISANLNFIKETGAGINPYVIKQVGKYRLAVIGILSDHFFEGGYQESVIINDPVKTLKKYLPEIKQQSDVIILLSHAGLSRTRNIIEEIPDIDIAIVGHEQYPDFESENFNTTRIFKNATGGGTVGVVKLWINSSGQIETIKNELALLDMRVQPLPEYSIIENNFNSEWEMLSDPIIRRDIEKAKEYLKLSPEEFFKQRSSDIQKKNQHP